MQLYLSWRGIYLYSIERGQAESSPALLRREAQIFHHRIKNKSGYGMGIHLRMDSIVRERYQNVQPKREKEREKEKDLEYYLEG